MKIENLTGGIKVNVDEALRLLVGETKIEQEDGYYLLEFDSKGGDLNVTVDYKGGLGYNCVFNESYSLDSHDENPFSFEQFIEDLHAQHLEDVENWIVHFLEEKFS